MGNRRIAAQLEVLNGGVKPGAELRLRRLQDRKPEITISERRAEIRAVIATARGQLGVLRGEPDTQKKIRQYLSDLDGELRAATTHDETHAIKQAAREIKDTLDEIAGRRRDMNRAAVLQIEGLLQEK